MTEDITDLPDYEGEEEKPAEDSLQRLRQMAVKMLELTSTIEEREKLLEESQKEYKRYANELVPALMKQIGVNSIGIAPGCEVQLKRDLHASLPQDERAEIWKKHLEDTGNDGLIKRQFEIVYGRDSTVWANIFLEEITKLGVHDHADVKQKETVHPQTLLAFLRRELEEGRLDEEKMKAFGAVEVLSAKISEKRKK